MRYLIFLMLLFFLILNLSTVNAIPNPAAVYCKNLGYKYKIVQVKGGEKGICIFPDKECEEWEFFAGKCGTEYSYCAKHGYGIKTKTDGKNAYSPEYAVCVMPGDIEKDVANLMNFKEIFSKYSVNLEQFSKTTTETITIIPEAQPATTIKIYDSEDAYVWDKNPNTNYGSDRILVRNESLGGGLYKEVANGWLKFDLSSLPSDIVITSAIVRMSMYSASPGTYVYVHFSPVDLWTESGIKWNNQPSYGGIIVGGYFDWDVTNSVKQEYNGDKKISLVFTHIVTDQGGCSYDSKEVHNWAYGHQPYLEITYTTTTFDWRDKNGQNWMTDVRDQGVWGTCWAFAPIGTVEAKINIVKNDPNFDINLSEQDIISCSNGGNCLSGNVELALKYINDTCVVEETCFPYEKIFCNQTLCSRKCSHPSRCWGINNYGHVPQQDSKNYIINKGPLVAYLYMSGEFDENGIYRCASIDPALPHVIVIVGYSDTGGYWIAKNSWGIGWKATKPNQDEPPPLDGYFYIGYGECNIQPILFVDTPYTCEGSVSLSLSPNPVWVGKTVTATISGLSNCDGRKVYVGIGQYEVLRCWCTVVGSGCSCTFDAPNAFTSDISYTFSARIDKNSDRDYTDPGEKASATLTVYCKASGQSCSQSEPCCISNYCSYGVCQYSAGGGCPVLKVWDGNGYKDVVKLDIHSEKGKDTTTSIDFSMKPKDGKYNVKLSEIWYALWEGSHIDSVTMTDKDGKECQLVSAVHNKKGDVLTAIAKSDDVRVETKPGEEIDLTFEGCKGEEFVFTIEGYNLWNIRAKLSLSQGNIIIIIIALISTLGIVFGFFKFFARKK